MYKLGFKERVSHMVDDAYSWYEEQSIGLGEEFLEELETCYNKVLKNPELYGFIENGFRHIKLKRFPYIVIYEIIEQELLIYAVFHNKRNPRNRIKD